MAISIVIRCLSTIKLVIGYHHGYFHLIFLPRAQIQFELIRVIPIGFRIYKLLLFPKMLLFLKMIQLSQIPTFKCQFSIPILNFIKQVNLDDLTHRIDNAYYRVTAPQARTSSVLKLFDVIPATISPSPSPVLVYVFL